MSHTHAARRPLITGGGCASQTSQTCPDVSPRQEGSHTNAWDYGPTSASRLQLTVLYNGTDTGSRSNQPPPYVRRVPATVYLSVCVCVGV